MVEQVTDGAVNAITQSGFEAGGLACRRGVCSETEYWIRGAWEKLGRAPFPLRKYGSKAEAQTPSVSRRGMQVFEREGSRANLNEGLQLGKGRCLVMAMAEQDGSRGGVQGSCLPLQGSVGFLPTVREVRGSRGPSEGRSVQKESTRCQQRVRGRWPRCS
jgi:hypothetical protein